MPVDKYACLETQIAVAAINGRADYEGYIEEQKNLFRQDYVNTCSAARGQADLRTQTQNYHYTLYYYDQADNLVRTVPPEGVNLLTGGQLAQVAVARLAGKAGCTYSGPTTTNVPLALQVLSNVLSYQGASAIETWLYNPGGGMNHFVETTTDKHWLYQLTIRKNKLGIDIYPMTEGVSPAKALFSPKSRHYRVTIPNTMLPLADWTHVVVQSASGIAAQSASALVQNPLPQIWLNGVQMTVAASVSPVGRFKVSAVGGVMQYPDSLSTLKHMRLYGRLMSPTEIWDNANNNCFMPDAFDNLWYRFNIPAAGGPTTIAATSTVETRCTPVYPDHTLRTTYAYNSTNQVVLQNSPDGGMNRFWYDLLSRLRISQNDKQGPNHDYSYTNYDVLGRIVEVGQINNVLGTSQLGQPDYVSDGNLTAFKASGIRSQISHTYYDEPVAHTGTNGIATVPTQHNLRKRVAASTYADTQTGPVTQATYYDYDLDGNVKTLYQQIAGLYKQPADTGLKKIDYEYDLISGKVNFVSYQRGKTDHFYYKYNYDSDNRLTDAWTGKEAVIDSTLGSDIIHDLKKLEAHYDYYLHGPLARTETGDQYGKVQGTDYAYTLQGWIKGVNGQSLNPNKDMGKDGRGGTGNNFIARDAYAYSLGYYTGDYKPIKDTASAFAMQYHSTGGDITGQSLYNGNISNRTLAISNIKRGIPAGYTYRYDQLNRIKQARQHTGISGTAWNSGSITNAYAESYTYDGNGNLLTQVRNGADTTGMPLAMDNLTYAHNYDSKGRLSDNRLRHIKDAVPNANYTSDLDNQPNDNYTYDAIGNRVSDYNAGITTINWTVYGKIDSITKSGNNIKYRYNTAGQRISKTVGSLNTYYVRDAQGNTLALYSDSASSIQHWKEQHLYGSSRLGIWTPGDWGIIGNRHYEFTDQRGNVLMTATDRRLQAGTSITVDHFIADVATASDTYSFGFEQPGRQYGAAQKYGYNGKENDDEIASENYGMRESDKLTSTFWSVDPLTGKYPELTPYQFASNRPIDGIDLDGKEYLDANESRIKISGATVSINLQNFNDVTRNLWDLRDERGPAVAGHIGYPQEIGRLIFPGLPELPANQGGGRPDALNLDNTYGANNPAYNSATHNVEAPTAASTGLPDRRFNEQAVSGASGATSGVAVGLLALNLINWGLDQYAGLAVADDRRKVNEHLSLLRNQVASVLTSAIKQNMIPTQYLNAQSLGDISNVVLTGVNPTKDPGIYNTGIKIVKEIAKNYKAPPKPARVYKRPLNDKTTVKKNIQPKKGS